MTPTIFSAWTLRGSRPLWMVLTLFPMVFAGQGNVQWGFSFPPVKDAREMAFTLGYLKSLGITRVRTSENWAIREPKKGSPNWAPLDARVTWALGNDLELLLTLETEAPAWCRAPKGGNGFTTDDGAFSNYVEALFSRYANQLPLVQFGNEWDGAGFTGKAEDFLKWHRVVAGAARRLSPKTRIVLGGVTQAWPAVRYTLREGKVLHPPAGLAPAPGWSHDRIEASWKREIAKLDQAGIEARVKKVFAEATHDIVDLHLYDMPETWGDSVRVIRELSDKPILVSEFGGPHPQWEAYDVARHRDFLKVALETLASLPILAAYHFTLVDHVEAWHKNNGLLTPSLREKPAYGIFKDSMIPP